MFERKSKTAIFNFDCLVLYMDFHFEGYFCDYDIEEGQVKFLT